MAASTRNFPSRTRNPAIDGQSQAAGMDQGSQNSPGHLMADGNGRRSAHEKFNVNTPTGGATFSIPIQTSAGRSGFGPSLSLIYDSGSSTTNGIFGLGWHLEGVNSITRKTSVSIPLYDDNNDTFVHSVVGELVPVLKGDIVQEGYLVRTYRPRVESDPMRIERWIETDYPYYVHWRTITSGNITVIYGKSGESRISQSNENGSSRINRVFSWLACEMYDSYGNQIVYEYKAEDAAGVRLQREIFEANRTDCIRTRQRYLKSIKYGNRAPNRDMDTWRVLNTIPGQQWMYQVILDYGEHDETSPTPQDGGVWAVRPDPFSTCRAGFEIRTYRRCNRILMFHNFEELGSVSCLTASTTFQYYELGAQPKSQSSWLMSSTIWGHSPLGNGQYSSLSLPPTEFEYSQPPDLGSLPVEDFNLDLSGLSTAGAQWVDLYGDGAPGVLVDISGEGWYYHRNQSDDNKTQIGGPTLVPDIPKNVGLNFEDLDGNGLLDLISISPDSGVRGFYKSMGDGKWTNFSPFRSYPTIGPFQSSWTVYNIDLTGDGHADILRMTPGNDGEAAWHQSLGVGGYGEEQRTMGAPKFLVEEISSTFLYDMNGDGLTDFVWVRNGNICFWPNLGYGKFGQKVVMENSPSLPDAMNFSPRRIRMADLTGSGGTDFIYMLPEGGALVYYNRWGNSWSDGYRLHSLPPMDGFHAVDIFDIGGRGTQCLCWTSDLHGNVGNAGLTTVHFVDLMGGHKPGLLTKSSNGIGGGSTITYRSSTRYYLDDEKAGRPWVTRLPFPIDCVASTTSVDLIAQTSRTERFAYHDGYYDPVERQFRGFRMVEHWDAEDFATDDPARFQRPPVLTKNWFFIGLQWLDEAVVLPGSLEIEKPQQQALSSAKISQDLAADEACEAYKALTGSPRRQEVYSDDYSSKSNLPYLISQQNYEVVMYQGTNLGQRRGIFRLNGREGIETHYERNLSESRVQHTLTLETDEYGNVKREAIINYGKQNTTLPKDEDRQKQIETVVHYTETDYTNPILDQQDYFYIPVVSEVVRYRVYPGSYLISALTEGRYDWEKLAADGCKLLKQAIDIPVYENAADWVKKIPLEGCKALLSKALTLYYQQDLKAPLPRGKLDAFSIMYQSYQLSVTTELLQKVLQDKTGPLLDSDALVQELQHGGYIQLGHENGGVETEWWTPSTRSIFKDDGGNDELHVARSQFYIPNVEIDQFQNSSRKWLDKYSLLLEKSVDAIENTTTFLNDYVHLQSKEITDTNGNRTQSALDPLGRAVGVAVMGKAGEDVGDSLDNFQVMLKKEDLDEFIRNPSGPIAAKLLGNAGKRTIYDLDRYKISHTPGFHAELVRDTHYKNGPTQISVRIIYVNGGGEAIQTVALSATQPAEKWQFSGWVIHDNKNQPVKQFLPFFHGTHHYHPQIDKPDAPATTLLRDPLGRVVGILNADRTWGKTRFTPWTQVVFDAGDNVLTEDPAEDEDVGGYFRKLERSMYYPTWYEQRMNPETPEEEKKAAIKSKIYNNTPKTIYMDTLGQKIITELDTDQGKRESRKDYDERGNISVLRDALDRVVTVFQCNLLGRPLHTINMDNGEHWLFTDCIGAPLLSWSSGGTRKRTSYDALRRIKAIKVKSPPKCASEILVVENVYGEECSQPRKNNLKGQLYQCKDQSGTQTNDCFDFHGNCIESSIQCAKEYKQLLDWSGGEVPLEPVIYKNKTSFDALGHPLRATAIGGDSTKQTYDIAGRLKTVESFAPDGITITSSVLNIEYSEDDNITFIGYRNGSQTTHTYDSVTRRLAATYISRNSNNTTLQDLSYTYDCLGKMVQKIDRAQQTVYFHNSVVPPSQEFWYDSLGQLSNATGREQVDGGRKRLTPHGAAPGQRTILPGDGSQLIEYEESYKYDLAGNIQEMKHTPRTVTAYSGWTRKYAYYENNNRLSSTMIGATTDTYKYEGEAGQNGCITTIPGYSMLSWDYDNQMRSFSTQRVGATKTPETTWYVYNSLGKRVRKVTERGTGSQGAPAPKKSKETFYLPLRDISKVYGGDGSTATQELIRSLVRAPGATHTPIVLVEYNSTTNTRLVRYQTSENLELDDSSKIISHEEYSPYGASTYRSYTVEAPRKYRFAAYQYDDESGLYLCGMRYYAAWLGRWTSTDPLGTIVDGFNLYSYVQNDPVNLEDGSGTCGSRRSGGSLLGKRGFLESQADTSQARSSKGMATRSSKSMATSRTQKPAFVVGRKSTPKTSERIRGILYPRESDEAENFESAMSRSDNGRRGSVNTAHITHLDKDSKALPVGVKDLMGCTSLFVVARGGIYSTHWWEEPSFTDEAEFQPTVIKALKQGLPGSHSQLDTEANKKTFANAHAILMTPLALKSHPENLPKAEQGDNPHNLIPNPKKHEPIYDKQVAEIWKTLKEILPGATQSVWGYFPSEAQLEDQDSQESTEVYGAALVEHNNGLGPKFTMHVGQRTKIFRFND